MYVNKLAKDKKTVIIVCPMQDLKAYDTEEGPDADRDSDKTVETQVNVLLKSRRWTCIAPYTHSAGYMFSVYTSSLASQLLVCLLCTCMM